jgi:(2Fe-2S) ferredoxin
MTAVATSGRPAQPQTQHDFHHYTKVKPEAATAVIELLMMGGKTPETCCAVNKRQDNKLKNCYIRLVIYLNEM